MEMADRQLYYCRINKDGKAETLTPFSGSWQRVTTRTATDKSVLIADSVVVRTTDLSLAPKTGDMLADFPVTSGMADFELKRAGCVTIKSVGDNRQGMGAHWKMEAV